MNKVSLKKLSEYIVGLVNKSTSTDDAVKSVNDYLNLYMIAWKKGPVHELSSESAKWVLTWDYDGWKTMSLFPSQDDWNMTLISKINQISAQIHQVSFSGGAQIIKAHPSMEDFFNTIPYYENGTISCRFMVEFDATININEIFVYRKDWNNVRIIPTTVHREINNENDESEWGMPELHFKHIGHFTDEEVSDYNKKLLGIIIIDNLPK